MIKLLFFPFSDRVYVEVPNYFKPYGHVAPYFLGVLLGYILAKKPKIQISWVSCLGNCQLISIFLILLIKN